MKTGRGSSQRMCRTAVGWMLGRRRAARMAQQTADWMAAVALKEVQFVGETV